MGFMDGMAAWLKHIIAVVLLASLVDLLLPNKTMQRYVRLVAGLFVLLTVATPVLQGIKGDFGQKLAADMESAQRSPDYAPDQLAQIEADGAKLRGKQQSLAADLVAAELSATIRSAVASSEHRAVKRVDVKTGLDQNGQWAVETVAIVLESPQATSADDGQNRPIADVKPIAPVGVDIAIEPSANPSPDDRAEEAQPAAGSDSADKPDQATQQRIAAFVAARFGIVADKVVVTQSRSAEETRS
jgi:stage III sporulation protein AF